jgi:hypothetical protein
MSGSSVVTLTPEQAAQLPGPEINLPQVPGGPAVEPEEPAPRDPETGAIVIDVFPREDASETAPAMAEGSGQAETSGAPAAQTDDPETPSLPSEDLGTSYQNARAQAEIDRTVAAVRERQRRRQQVAEVSPREPPARRQRGAAQAATTEQPEPEIVAPLPDGPGWGARMLRSVGTVMRHGADGFMQVPGGMVAAVRESFRAADDVANYLTGAARPDPGQPRPAGWAGNPGEAIAQTIERNNPIPAPSTGTGRVVHELSQFVSGFLRGQRVLRRVGVLQGGGAMRTAQRAAAAGAIADFFYNEADEANLLSVARQVGMPVPVITEFLATAPDDDAALNRMRNAVVGSATGAAVDGAIAVLRAARAGFAARRASQGVPAGGPTPAPLPPQTLTEAAGVPASPARDLMIVGDDARPLFEVRRGDAAARVNAGEQAAREAGPDAPRALVGVADDMATGGVLSGRQEAPEVFINWGRIATPDDVQGVIRDMAESFRGTISEAQRGVQTNAETRRLADQLGLTVEDLLSRQRGQPLNAETALAARNLYTASGEQLLAAARAAAAPGAGPLEQAAFRRMMAVHYAIQAQVLGARTETARALQAWAIPSASGRDQMRMISDLMEQSGGADVSAAMARRLAMLGNNLPAEQLAPALGAFVNRGWAGRSLEAIQQVWINALLSSPATHITNMTGNALNLYLSVIERSVASSVAAGRGATGGQGVMPGESVAMLYGMVSGFGDALRLMRRTYLDDGAEVAAMIGRQDLPRQGAISSQAWGADAGSGLGRALDFIGHSVVSAPGRSMGAEDAFFKSMLYRMELHASALRESYGRLAARNEQATPQALGAEMARVMRDPPEHVRVAAADMALYATFNREAGPITQALMQLRTTDSAGWNLAASIVLPFVRTPANIFSYGFERTPFAPIVGTWRADVAAGGARRDLALARVATGSMLLASAFTWADAGSVTGGGPDDPGEREIWQRAHQPYSIRVGDAWVSYNRLDPFGFVMGMAADVADMVRRADIEPEEIDEFQELSNALVVMVGRAVVNRSFMQGVANITDALNTRQPNAERLIGNTIQSFAAPGAMAAATRALDPYQREAMNILDRIRARVPGLSSGLTPRRDFWGRPLRHGLESMAGSEQLAAAVSAISPMRMQNVRNDPVDIEMARLNMNVEGMRRAQTFNGTPVNMRDFPQALDRLRVLFGQDARVPMFGDKGLHDALAEMIEGRGPRGAEYRAGTDGEEGSRARLINRTVTAFRDAARQQVLREHRDLARYVAQRADQRSQQRAGPPTTPIPRTPRAPMPSVDRSLPPEMR